MTMIIPPRPHVPISRERPPPPAHWRPGSRSRPSLALHGCARSCFPLHRRRPRSGPRISPPTPLPGVSSVIIKWSSRPFATVLVVIVPLSRLDVGLIMPTVLSVAPIPIVVTPRPGPPRIPFLLSLLPLDLPLRPFQRPLVLSQSSRLSAQLRTVGSYSLLVPLPLFLFQPVNLPGSSLHRDGIRTRPFPIFRLLGRGKTQCKRQCLLFCFFQPFDLLATCSLVIGLDVAGVPVDVFVLLPSTDRCLDRVTQVILCSRSVKAERGAEGSRHTAMLVLRDSSPSACGQIAEPFRALRHT